MTTPRARRPFHLVVWGATGFTGRLVAEYLAAQRLAIPWALAGRSLDKLKEVRKAVAAIDPALAELPLQVADAHDLASMQKLADAARVVITTVGPYADYGTELVAACAEGGTDYVDLTGEAHFVRQTIDRHHQRAKKSGARIVPCCGYDSIPSDLGTLYLQTEMKARFGSYATEVRTYAGEVRGGFSGGTVATILSTAAHAGRDPEARRALGNPYSLDPERTARGHDGGDPMGIHYDADLKRWSGPFIMASINAKMVRRTHALLGYPWGEGFRYQEAFSTRPGWRGFAQAAGITAATAGIGIGAVVGPLRRLLQKTVLPAPGEGPSAQERERGHFAHRLVGVDSAGHRLLATVKGYHDPGYGETCRMLSESALCLAQDDEIPKQGGVLTPASALGMRLVERLRNAGMTFEVDALPGR